MAHPLAKACCSRDLPYIAGYIAGRYYVYLSPDEVAEFFTAYFAWAQETRRVNAELMAYLPDDNRLGFGWSDGSWDGWLKNRLLERGLLYQRPRPLQEEATYNSLHVFFISISETPDMLARLRGGVGQPANASKVARSKMFATQLVPTPIDGTAARVTE